MLDLFTDALTDALTGTDKDDPCRRASAPRRTPVPEPPESPLRRQIRHLLVDAVRSGLDEL